jgi:hypothetical protein
VSGTAALPRTKNGEAIVAALSKRAFAELAKLPGKHHDAFIFAGRTGQPIQFRSVWLRVTGTDAGAQLLLTSPDRPSGVVRFCCLGVSRPIVTSHLPAWGLVIFRWNEAKKAFLRRLILIG